MELGVCSRVVTPDQIIKTKSHISQSHQLETLLTLVILLLEEIAYQEPPATAGLCLWAGFKQARKAM
jgi:hypothetical protein